jgi:subtilisin-like proprotein convertase family protein
MKGIANMNRTGRTLLAALTAGLIALVALPAAAGAATWTQSNPTALPIPVNPGPTTPYPSTITLANLPGSLTKVTATFVGLKHTDAGDIDAALVGPGGQNVILMSDSCGNLNDPGGRTLTFDDAAPGLLAGTCPSGSYKPTNGAGADVFPPTGPVAPFGSALSAFNGGSANGNWNLYLVDDGPISGGNMEGGWRLAVTTDANETCDGKQATILGTDAADDISGTPGDDVISGFGGRDDINGLGGKDTICGGPANDKLSGGPGKDRLLGDAGGDKLLGGGGKDRLLGGAGKDNCKGQGGKDRAPGCETRKSI